MNIMYARFEPEPLFERMIRIHRMFHRKWMPMQFCINEQFLIKVTTTMLSVIGMAIGR